MVGSLLRGPAIILISKFVDEDRETTIDFPSQAVDDELLTSAAPTLKKFGKRTLKLISSKCSCCPRKQANSPNEYRSSLKPGSFQPSSDETTSTVSAPGSDLHLIFSPTTIVYSRLRRHGLPVKG